MSVSGKSGVLTCNVEQVENVTTNWICVLSVSQTELLHTKSPEYLSMFPLEVCSYFLGVSHISQGCNNLVRIVHGGCNNVCHITWGVIWIFQDGCQKFCMKLSI
jgi:hypothetical protein